MRTTLTLDDDVAASLQRVARKTRRTFRAVVNDAIRAGIEAQSSALSKPFEVTPLRLGGRKLPEIDSISELLELVEGPLHR